MQVLLSEVPGIALVKEDKGRSLWSQSHALLSTDAPVVLRCRASALIQTMQKKLRWSEIFSRL